MRLFILALVSSLAALGLTAASPSAIAARPAPPPPPAIADYHVQAGGTVIDAETHVTYRLYTITVDFTHLRGDIAIEVHEHAAPTDAQLTENSIGSWESRIGTGTLSVEVGAPVGQAVYFEVFLFKPEVWYGKPSQRGEVIYDSRTTGTYND
jgi:hypothetical protein